jgi:glycosyltransferase involved in cell wall biosynthesis
MKVLHVSQLGLPDWRVEKSALTGINYGYRVFFAGNLLSDYHTYDSKIFEKLYKIEWPDSNYPKNQFLPYILFGKTSIWNSVKKQIKEILGELRPDIVHAHNLQSAKLISEFDVPMIYNDHEYWSIYIKRIYESKLLKDNGKFASKKKNFLYNRIIKIWSKWESDIVSKYPTIVTSKTTLNEMEQKYSKEIFLLPNFPMKNETSMSQSPRFHDELSSVYAGIESLKGIPAHRNMIGLERVFDENDVGKLILIGKTNFQPSEKVIDRGLLSRDDMYTEMAKCSIGLLPMKRIRSHKYINPNKTFEYAHAGLHIICTSSFTDVISTLQNNCTIFDDYNDLTDELLYFHNNKEELYKNRINIFNFAKEHLLWEKYEKNILEAYKSI